MHKELSEGMMPINKEKLLKKNQVGILELKSTITEMTNLLDKIDSRFNLAEERSSTLENNQQKSCDLRNREIKKKKQK